MEWVAAFVHLDQINCCANNRIISGILYYEETPDLEIIYDLLSASKSLSIHFLDAALKVSC